MERTDKKHAPNGGNSQTGMLTWVHKPTEFAPQKGHDAEKDRTHTLESMVREQ